MAQSCGSVLIGFKREIISGPGLGALLIRSTLGSAGLRVLGMLLTFLVGVQLARGLGVENYGAYSLAMSIIALLMVPTEFGLPQLLTREISSAHVKKDWGRFLGVIRWSNRIVLITSLALSLLVGLGLFMLADRVQGGFYGTLLIGLGLVPVVALAKMRGATLRALKKIVQSQLPDLVVRPGAFALLLFIAFETQPHLGPAPVMGLQVLAALVALLVSSVLLRADLPDELRHVTPEFRSGLWSSSALPMALTEGMRMLQGHAAILLLGLLSISSEGGLFRVANSTGVMVALPMALLNIVAAPMIARLYAEGEREKLQKLLSYVVTGMVAGVLALALPLIFFGKMALGFIFGSAFSQAYFPLVIICSGHLFSSLFGANAALLNMTNYERRVTRAFGWSLIANLGSAFVLIPYLDSIGAAIANSVGLIIWNIILWRDASARLNLDTSFTSFKHVRTGT